jgi:3-hydroxybutyryl-CoA dehydratase
MGGALQLLQVTRRFPAVLSVGDYAAASRVMRAADVQAFGELAGDMNPLHFDADFASTSRFGRPIVHGMLYATIFNAIIAASMPGAVHISQTFEFKQPVFVGDEVTARLEVQAVAPAHRMVAFVESCVNQHGETVLTGTASLMAPRRFLRPLKAKAASGE